MIINADYNLGYLYQVWDCERCKFLDCVKWVDDIANKYCVVAGFKNNEIHYRTIKAKILIIPEIKIIYINPKQTRQELINDYTAVVTERARQ